MAYILVTLTILLVLTLTVAVALLGSDRVFPARRVIEYVSTDGVDIASAVEPAHVLADDSSPRELRRVKFATAVAGYNKDEVEQFVQLLIDENTALRASISTAETQRSESDQ